MSYRLDMYSYLTPMPLSFHIFFLNLTSLSRAKQGPNNHHTWESPTSAHSYPFFSRNKLAIFIILLPICLLQTHSASSTPTPQRGIRWILSRIILKGENINLFKLYEFLYIIINFFFVTFNYLNYIIFCTLSSTIYWRWNI